MTEPGSAPPSRAAKVWKRTWIGALMVAVLAGALEVARRDPSGRFVLAAAGLLALLVALELARLGTFATRGLAAPLVTAWVALAAGHAAGVFGSDGALPWWGSIPLAALAAALVALPRAAAAKGTGAPSSPMFAGLLAAWALPPLFELARVRIDLGAGGLVALLVLSKVGDIAGYFVGNAIGKTHPFKRISPGKTTAGCVGSLVAGTLAGLACARLGLLPLGDLGGLAVGALLNLAAQAGDLSESWVKRRAGAKDSGTWFGPAGGVLDLVDSLLLSTPVLLALEPLF